MYERVSHALKSESGAIDLASIMIGVVITGLIGGVIAATVFAVIPWAQDNAAKQQIDNVRAAQSAYVGLHTETASGAYQYGNLTDQNSSIAKANLMVPNQNKYCSESYDWSGEKGYVTFALSDSGKIFWSQNGGAAEIAPMPRRATCLVRPAEQLWNIEDDGLRYQVMDILGVGGGDDLLLTDAARLDNAAGAQLNFGGVRSAAGLEKATNLTALGNVSLSSFEDTRGLENIRSFANLSLDFGRLSVLSLPSLQEVPGTVSLMGDALTSISAPNLSSVGRLEITETPVLREVKLAALNRVGSLRLAAPSVTDLDVSRLQIVDSNADFASGSFLTLNLASLQSVGGLLSFGAGYSPNFKLSSVNLSNLTTVGAVRSYTENRPFESFNADLQTLGAVFIYVNSRVGDKVYTSIEDYLAGSSS